MTDRKPVTPIELVDPDGRLFVLIPRPDMTPIESALLSQLFIKLVLNRTGLLPDWPTYVEQYKLQRHFVEVTQEGVMPGAIIEVPSGEPLPKPVVLERSLSDGTTYRMTILEGMPIPEGYTVMAPGAA